jgi:hypothetical protein
MYTSIYIYHELGFVNAYFFQGTQDDYNCDAAATTSIGRIDIKFLGTND